MMFAATTRIAVVNEQPLIAQPPHQNLTDTRPPKVRGALFSVDKTFATVLTVEWSG